MYVITYVRMYISLWRSSQLLVWFGAANDGRFRFSW